jgi:hypothetical protein
MSQKLQFLSFLSIIFLITTVSFSQVTRKVLFEEGTNASCGPCAASNPILEAFLQANETNVQSIMYHASWPGVDPMYSSNPTQNTERIVNYYNMGPSGVPYCNCDGLIQDIWPFSNTAFMNAMNTRLAVTSLIGITVNDLRIAGDSIKSSISLNVVSNLPSGNYKLRVMAIEKKIVYSTPPGSNGETIFYTVFRRAYPNTDGVVIPTNSGVYNYTYTYKRETAWIDTSMYTVAFVQNDNNKEVINSAKGAYIATGIGNFGNGIPAEYSLSQNYPNPFNPVTTIKYSIPNSGFVSLKVFDILGKEVITLVNGNAPAGNYSVEFHSGNLASGLYFYKFNSGNFSDTKKLVITK